MTNSLYDRSAIENLMKDMIGSKNVDETLADELLVVAFDYNSQKPRFFSKYFAKQDPGIYKIKTSIATGGSSAAPGFFQP